jgi:hypothetical protein
VIGSLFPTTCGQEQALGPIGGLQRGILVGFIAMNGDERSLALPGAKEWIRPEPVTSPEVRYGPNGASLDDESLEGGNRDHAVFVEGTA